MLRSLGVRINIIIHSNPFSGQYNFLIGAAQIVFKDGQGALEAGIIVREGTRSTKGNMFCLFYHMQKHL
jgi:hypothetical protein